MLKSLLLLSVGLMGDHSHYLIMFAHQHNEKDWHVPAKGSHSFGTWVEVDEDHNICEVFTISWVGNLGVKFWEFHQTSHNRDLLESLQVARRRCLKVTMWGPFGISECFYRQAKKHYDYLMCSEATQSNKYAVMDAMLRLRNENRSFNCIHALTDVCGHYVSTAGRHGNKASEFIIEKYREQFRFGQHCSKDDWVWDAIRPEGFCIERAD
jgi:hypothetical protein